MHDHDDPDELCICFHVGRQKIIRYVKREKPRVVSLISQCLSAGTGCGWCIPFLEQIHEDVSAGREPEPAMDAEEYRRRRKLYHARIAEGAADPRAE